MKLTIEIKQIKKEEKNKFPKHVSGFLNTANERARSTSKELVGSVDDLFQEFLKENKYETDLITLEKWEEFHKKRFLKNFQTSKEKLSEKVEEILNNIKQIDEEMIEAYLKDLLYKKTFEGKIIEFRIYEEFKKLGYDVIIDRDKITSNNTDLLIDGKGYQIKPIKSRFDTNKINFNENIEYIYYKKLKDRYEIHLPKSLEK